MTNRQRLTYLLVTATVLVILVLPLLRERGGDRGEVKERYTRILMGTLVEFTLYGESGKGGALKGAAERGYSRIAELEEIFSSYKAGSDVSRIGRAEAGTPVEVSPEVVSVIGKALYVARLTDGAFDPTFGPLTSLWDFQRGDDSLVPTRDEVGKVLPLIDYKAVGLDKEQRIVTLGNRGMTINLGGVAKAYIVGEAVKVLKEGGVSRGIVKAGGDMFIFDDGGFMGKGGDGEGILIGLQDPRDEGGLLGTISVASGAVATSGDYERVFFKGGKRYHHIMDPKTGFPARRSRSATVVTDDPTLADALSTAFFVMGYEAAMKVVEGLQGVEALIVDSEGGVYISKGLEGRVVLKR